MNLQVEIKLNMGQYKANLMIILAYFNCLYYIANTIMYLLDLGNMIVFIDLLLL